MHTSPMIKMMMDAAQKAGRSLLRDFNEVEHLQVSKKGPGDFVSAADHRSEEILVRELSKVRPDYGFLLEEGGEVKGKDETHRWIIDPLDGTRNFLRSVPHFCISIGLEQRQPNGKREIIAGVVYAPIQNEMYFAEKGQGAYVNNRRLLVAPMKTLEGSLIGTGGMRRMRVGGEQTRELVEELFNLGAQVIILGASALELAYVAAGRLDGLCYASLKPWDLAAGTLIVREAKGFVSEISGKKDMFETGNVIAGNLYIHGLLGKIVPPFFATPSVSATGN